MFTEIFSEIVKKYEKLQKKAYDELEERKRELYARIPQLEVIDEKIRGLGIEYSRKILAEGEIQGDPAEDLEKKVMELKDQRKALLQQYGLDENALSPSFSCPSCSDTGYVQTETGFVKCSCFRQQLINAHYGASNLEALDANNFGFFNEALYPDIVDEKKYGIKITPRENILNIKKKCERFIQNFDSPDEKNLLFMGAAGLGKTFMSNCIAKALLDQGRTVLYQTAPALFDITSEYKCKKFTNSEYDDSSYRSIFEAELLIIDDLGTEAGSEAKFAELFHILNTRILNNETRACKTIISTNLGSAQLLEYYTDRVVSRIAGHFEICRFAGEDIRLMKTLKSR